MVLFSPDSPQEKYNTVDWLDVPAAYSDWLLAYLYRCNIPLVAASLLLQAAASGSLSPLEDHPAGLAHFSSSLFLPFSSTASEGFPSLFSSCLPPRQDVLYCFHHLNVQSTAAHLRGPLVKRLGLSKEEGETTSDDAENRASSCSGSSLSSASLSSSSSDCSSLSSRKSSHSFSCFPSSLLQASPKAARDSPPVIPVGLSVPRLRVCTHDWNIPAVRLSLCASFVASCSIDSTIRLTRAQTPPLCRSSLCDRSPQARSFLRGRSSRGRRQEDVGGDEQSAGGHENKRGSSKRRGEEEELETKRRRKSPREKKKGSAAWPESPGVVFAGIGQHTKQERRPSASSRASSSSCGGLLGARTAEEGARRRGSSLSVGESREALDRHGRLTAESVRERHGGARIEKDYRRRLRELTADDMPRRPKVGEEGFVEVSSEEEDSGKEGEEEEEIGEVLAVHRIPGWAWNVQWLDRANLGHFDWDAVRTPTPPLLDGGVPLPPAGSLS